MLAGTVAATLAGLVFVAISFAVGAKTERRADDLNAWVTPSLVYFVEVFVTASAAVAPLSMAVFGGLILGGLAIGTPFAVWRMRYFLAEHRAEALDIATWMFQIVLPSLSHVAIGGGAALLLAGDPRGMLSIAGGVTVLVLCAVRNAWTLVVFLLEQR